MSSAEQKSYVTVADYLAAEELATTKSEYVDGWVRAMTGATNRHNCIAINAIVCLANQLRGKPCRPSGSDTKIRIRNASSTKFYYPDVSVMCEHNRSTDVFEDRPVVIMEVLSPSTRGIDLDEKLANYLTIESLQYYVMLEQHKPLVIALRRTANGFLREVYEGLSSGFELPEIECYVPFEDLYANIDFTPIAIQEPIPVYE